MDSTQTRTRPLVRVGIAGLVVLGFALLSSPMHDNSLFTHIQTGRWIVENQRVPVHDIYSWTANGQPWVVQSWFASLLYGLAEAVGGARAIIAVHALVGAIIAGVVVALGRRHSIGALLATSGAGLVVAAFGWAQRPLLVGLACFAAMMWIVVARRSPWWLIPIMWIWVNSHGSFVVGIGWLFFTLVGSWWDVGRARDQAWKTYGRYVIAAIVGLAVSALNPIGWRLLGFGVNQMLFRGDAFRDVMEWQSPNVHEAASAVQVMILLTALGVALWRRAPWSVLLPALVVVGAGLYTQRHLVLAGLVIVPMLGAVMTPKTVTALSVDRAERWISRVGLGGIGIVAVACIVRMLLQDPFCFAAYPVKATNALLDDASTPHERIVHRDMVGNYLTLRYSGEQPVFVDDRVDMYPDHVLVDQRDLLRARVSASDVLDRRGADAVIWASDTPLVRELKGNPGWAVVYEDKDWTSLKRSSFVK